MGARISKTEMDEVDKEAFEIIAALSAKPLVAVLRALQRQEGCLTEASLKALAKDRLISLTRLFGIASSYPEFKFEKEAEAIRAVSPPVELPAFLAAGFSANAVQRHGVLSAGLTSLSPASLADYEAAGGLKALRRSLEEMSTEQVLSEVLLGGLTRKPGAWQAVEKSTQGSVIIASAHAGDPTASQAGLLVEKDPYTVLEGMFIAARAVGASRGFLFLEPELAGLSAGLTEAVEEIQRAANINFAVEVVCGPRSLVGSEDSVAVGAIERDRPVPLPVDPAVRGIWAKPTLVDAAECFAAIARTLATGKRVTTRLYQVCGAVDNPGIFEVEPDLSVNELLLEAGAGDCSVALVGGLSGTFVWGEGLGRSLLSFERTDSPRWRTVQPFANGFDVLAAAAEAAAYNARYLCGYCLPCRIGALRMAELFSRASGNAGGLDRKTLIELSTAVERSGLCHTGRAAAGMVFSALEAEKTGLQP